MSVKMIFLIMDCEAESFLNFQLKIFWMLGYLANDGLQAIAFYFFLLW